MDKPNSITIKGRICGETLKPTNRKYILETMYIEREKSKSYMSDGIVAKSAIPLLHFRRSYVRGESSCS